MADEQPTTLVLDVMVRSGSLASWMPIAAGLNPGQLNTFLLEWINRNQARYAGNYRILQVPFLLPPEGESHG